MLQHNKCLFAITRNNNSLHSSCDTSVEPEDTDNKKIHGDEPMKINQKFNFQEHQLEQLLNLSWLIKSGT